jgi:hypothetical protein
MLFSLIGKKSKAEEQQDVAFLDALSRIKTLQVRDGCVSMDISDLKTRVRDSREKTKGLVAAQR